ncbi:MAG: hypothetical protein M3394_00090 [Actinomycetota bacterium]|nr:hypothetical protein [Actinomycetota bacterium]
MPAPTQHDLRHLAEARAALAAVTPDIVRVIRHSAHEGRVLGHWGTGEVAAHLSHVIRLDTDAIAGRVLPPAELHPAGVADVTDAELAADPERDPDALAARVETLMQDFLAASEAPADDHVSWLGGVRLPASAVACHLLEEVLVHGFDLARPTNQQWSIRPAHAALSIVGAVAPIVTAAGPTAFLRSRRAAEFRARVEVRLRGHDRLAIVFDNGLTIEPGARGPFDAHVSVDPASMLLLLLNRVSRRPLLLRGKIVVWGRRPWQVARMTSMITPP